MKPHARTDWELTKRSGHGHGGLPPIRSWYPLSPSGSSVLSTVPQPPSRCFEKSDRNAFFDSPSLRWSKGKGGVDVARVRKSCGTVGTLYNEPRACQGSPALSCCTRFLQPNLSSTLAGIGERLSPWRMDEQAGATGATWLFRWSGPPPDRATVRTRLADLKFRLILMT